MKVAQTGVSSQVLNSSNMHVARNMGYFEAICYIILHANM